MKTRHLLMVGLMVLPTLGWAAPNDHQNAERTHVQTKRLTESDRKVEAGRILLKWGGYVEKVEGQDRKTWAASMWPSLASADLGNLQKASRAVTYEGMRNALLGQRPYDDQVIDRAARAKTAAIKSLGQLGADLVFTPITPCRIVDTRVAGGRIASNVTRDLDASNVGGNFVAQGGSDTNCGIPANPAALALSVTGLSNTSTGYLRVFPFTGTSAQGSPVPLNAINTTVTNDIIVPAAQGATQELKIFSTANTHYAAFVTGYFMAPLATSLECVDVDKQFDIGPNTTSSDFVYCPAGYRSTGAGCNTDRSTARVVEVYAEGQTYNDAYCEVANPDATATTATARVTCCRVPGR